MMRKSCRPFHQCSGDVSHSALGLLLFGKDLNEWLPDCSGAINGCARQAYGLSLGRPLQPLSTCYSDVPEYFFAQASDYGTTSQQVLSRFRATDAASCRLCLIACNSRQIDEPHL